jgi:hypothetical protein
MELQTTVGINCAPATSYFLQSNFPFSFTKITSEIKLL